MASKSRGISILIARSRKIVCFISQHFNTRVPGLDEGLDSESVLVDDLPLMLPQACHECQVDVWIAESEREARTCINFMLHRSKKSVYDENTRQTHNQDHTVRTNHHFHGYHQISQLLFPF